MDIQTLKEELNLIRYKLQNFTSNEITDNKRELKVIDDTINILSKYHCTCSHCNKLMYEGYVINDGLEYYCSEDCLHEHYTDEEYFDMFEECDAYWTDWSE